MLFLYSIRVFFLYRNTSDGITCRSIWLSDPLTVVVSLMCLIWVRLSSYCSGYFLMCRWTGKDRVEFLERLLVSDIHSLQPTQGRLSLICQEDGGILDDTVITNAGDYQ